MCKKGKKTDDHGETVLGKAWITQPVFGIGSLLESSIKKITRHCGLVTPAGNTAMSPSHPIEPTVNLK